MNEDNNSVEGGNIADAIAAFMLENSDTEIMPIVGGFTLIAEVIDPDTGMQGLFTLQDASLPIWTEYGMLMLRISELNGDVQANVMGEVYEEWDED